MSDANNSSNGSSSSEGGGGHVVHGKPTPNMCCLVSYEDITEEDGNYVEYQVHPSGAWKPCKFEKDSVEYLLNAQFEVYMKSVKTTDCQAELKRESNILTMNEWSVPYAARKSIQSHPILFFSAL
jgi:hypothetical protein